MKYLCLVFYDENKLKSLDESEAQALIDESLDYDDVLRKGGHLIAANALYPVQDAKTIRHAAGKALVTNGPFAETSEQIGGFVLLEAADLHEATRLASKLPPVRFGGVEVRPIMELTHSKNK